MKCPACKRVLKKLDVGSVSLDVCQTGCGGVWFDAEELESINSRTATGKNPVAMIDRAVEVETGEDRVIKCVRCRGVKLERKLFSLGSGVIMDRCPRCGGLWLDHGELEAIREETNPMPKPVRSVVRQEEPKSIPISFAVVRKIQQLRVQI